ncbi:helix-hairpin-helix domain-containing protein [Raoultibacter massiliensis]|uniref:Helix-hairpin-helix domain-containing protein n=1 Tax=Raoultibacter massiliensis TaxID=1852371 RepID=A0ABV1J971_9ACTN|nr:helix-hairpin-helix domain-containing protein [Raoultibacter massiliensis]
MSKGEPAMSTDLITIPGVGPNMKARLQAIGISCVEDLAGADPEELYARDCMVSGGDVDRCCLYVYREAVYFAETEQPDPEKLQWWAWKD